MGSCSPTVCLVTTSWHPPAMSTGSQSRAVYLKSASEATHNYERFHEMHVKRLGLSGLFRWKHLGWKDSPE